MEPRVIWGAVSGCLFGVAAAVWGLSEAREANQIAEIIRLIKQSEKAAAQIAGLRRDVERLTLRCK